MFTQVTTSACRPLPICRKSRRTMTIWERANKIMQIRHGEKIRSRQVQALAEAVEERLRLLERPRQESRTDTPTNETTPQRGAERL